MSKPTFHDSLGRLVIARTSRHAGGLERLGLLATLNVGVGGVGALGLVGALLLPNREPVTSESDAPLASLRN